MAKETVSEEEIQLRKRARRRLVGAIALALAAAVFLPMIMDGEMKPVGNDVSIQIPDKRIVAALPATVEPGGSAPSPAPTAASQPAPAQVAEAKPAAAAQAAPAEKAATETAPHASESPKPAEKAKHETKPEARPKANPEAKPAPQSKSAPDAPSRHAAEGKPAGGQFFVQLGAFSNEENVRQLQFKLAANGINTYTEPLKTEHGEKTRVRAGPYPSKAAAQAVSDKLRQLGVSGVVASK